MNPADQKLLQDAEQFVKHFIPSRVDKAFVFHNINHTTDVVKACETIAAHQELNERDMLCLLLAAWFHDTGYSNGAIEHEEASQKIASSFLSGKGIEQDIINQVNCCIMSTKIPQSPSNLAEQIICDADLYHLGTEDFAEKTKLLRQEIKKLQHKDVDKKKWLRCI